MASARIAAIEVYKAADAKNDGAIAAAKQAKQDWFDERLRAPVKRGVFLWRRDHYRTQAELEAAYVHTSECSWRSQQYLVEREHADVQQVAIRLRNLAKAALSGLHSGVGKGHGDGFVTLDADEVRFLGLESRP